MVYESRARANGLSLGATVSIRVALAVPAHRPIKSIYRRRLGLEQLWGARIVNHADDFVICCKRGAQDAMTALRTIMQRLKLTVNEEKTHMCQIPQEGVGVRGVGVRSPNYPVNGRPDPNFPPA